MLVDGVEHMGPVEADAGDAAAEIEKDGIGIGHGLPRISLWQRWLAAVLSYGATKAHRWHRRIPPTHRKFTKILVKTPFAHSAQIFYYYSRYEMQNSRSMRVFCGLDRRR